MSWLSPADTTAPEFDTVLGLQPKLLEKYRVFMQQLWQDPALPTRTAELCRLRIAAIHGCQAELAWGVPAARVQAQELDALVRNQVSGFSNAERLALQVAELMPLAHHNISDTQVQGLAELLGEAGTVALLTACAFFDVNRRLKLSLEIAPAAPSQRQPQSPEGPLL